MNVFVPCRVNCERLMLVYVARQTDRLLETYLARVLAEDPEDTGADLLDIRQWG